MLTMEALEVLGRAKRFEFLAQAETARRVPRKRPGPGPRSLAARAARELGALFFTLGDAIDATLL